MRFSVISVLFFASAGMVSALSSERAFVPPVTRSTTATSEKVEQAAAALKGSSFGHESETSNCVGSLLCCGPLTTPYRRPNLGGIEYRFFRHCYFCWHIMRPI
ncbi:Hydrophobin [Penicillium frequentans]|nr:Hydrophobin [Penicillium glabrum]